MQRFSVRGNLVLGVACQRHSGTQIHRYGCSLPGLTGFTAYCCGGTSRTTIAKRPGDLPQNATQV